jgi:sugar phosphate isomerase/epimerase
MKIGTMTNPQRRLEDEIRLIAAEGFDFADLAIEAPQAEPEQIDAKGVKRVLNDLGLGVICHAAPYLPVHNPSARVRRAALDELLRSLDVGHANIGVPKNQTREYLFSLADRLVHVHLSDNDGTADQHLPLGAPAKGGVSWRRVAADLKSFGYDGTITLEVFAGERSYRQDSAARWRRWWAAPGAE